jgi:CO/xanthine dehydrogenase Mo-binding subunit
MTTATSKTFRVVGTRPIRHDGLEKVTGRAKYAAYFQIAGLLHAKILRSPHAHARIKSIDASAAEALPGVKAVVTAADIPAVSDKVADLGETAVRMRFLSNNVLASDKVLYKGHAVAAVAATSPHIAEEALALINVDYQVLPAVVNVQDAIKDGAPLLHEEMVTQELGKRSDKHSNIANHFRFLKGDPEKGFAQADAIIEREFHTAAVHQGYIEPHSATAVWAPDGNITIWCSTQGSFNVRSLVAQLLKVPESKIRVVPMEIGGGFGGKLVVYLEPIAALLSRKTGHPVKMVMSRTEVFEATGPTPGSHIKIKMGADKDGDRKSVV